MFCIGLGVFLTLAATVLSVLTNISQLTNNVVSRHIRIVEIDTTGFQTFLQTNASLPADVFAADQSAPELTGQGLKRNYQWGLYTFCAGESTSGLRSCAPRSIGFRFEPLEVLQQDANQQYSQPIENSIGTGKFTDSEYLGKFTHAANYLFLVGTIATGLAFLTAWLAHRFAFALAALLSLIGALLLGVGAAIWTAVQYKARHSLPSDVGISFSYGNGLWMMWGAFVADILAFIPLITSCLVGRSKY